MTEVLTQQQIDELLGNLHSGEIDIKQMEQETAMPKVKDYDFRSPKKISRDQLKFLDNIYDNFARFFSLQLTSLLRVSCEIEIVQIEEEEYKEFNNALDDSVLVGIFGVTEDGHHNEDGQLLVEMARPLSFSILDLLLGGDGSGYNIEREYTEIEISVMEYLYRVMANHLANGWSNYAEIRHKLDMIETNSRVIQFIAPDESIVIIAMELTVDHLKGSMNICVPTAVLETVFSLFDSKIGKQLKKDFRTAEEQSHFIFDTLKQSQLQVTGTLGYTDIELQDLLVLQKGDVIVLDKAEENSPVELMIEGIPWFSGEVGTFKKNYAVKINDVLNQ